MKKTINLLNVSIVLIAFASFNSGVRAQEDDAFKTVKIGNQIWMAENLNVIYFRNGDSIPEAKMEEKWIRGYLWGDDYQDLEVNPYWCNYNNDPSNGEKYGKLYNFRALDDSRGLCPLGWHIPSDEDWKELEIALGMSESDAESHAVGDWRGKDEGSKLKATSGWEGEGIGTNSSGFNALPGGRRDNNGSFTDFGISAIFWSSSSSNFSDAIVCRELSSNYSAVSRDYSEQGEGLSIRCVKDN